MTLQELRQKRIKLFGEARGIFDAADKEKRALTATEAETYDKIMGGVHPQSGANVEGEIDKIDVQIRELQQEEGRRSRLAQQEQAANEPAGRRSSGSDGRTTATNERVEYRRKQAGGSESVITLDRMSPEQRSAVIRYMQYGSLSETRDLLAESQVDGGAIVLPQQMAMEFVKFVDDAVYIRQLATIITLTNSSSLGVPSLDTDASDAEWTSEIGTGSDDTGMKFGKRELKPVALAKRAKVSKTLIRRAVQSVDTIVRDRIGYKLAVGQENGFLTGTGDKQPLGVFTASTDGISTSRDVSTDNTTTAVTADGLINAKYALKSQYMGSPTTKWLFHRNVVRDIRKLKDAENRYLLQPDHDLRSDQHESLLELGVLMSEFAPSTMTTGKYVGIVGDWKFYYIAEALNIDLQVLNELYAEKNQIGYIARQEVDGMPILEEAFARVKLA